MLLSYSIAGSSNEKKLAAIMIPAAPPVSAVITVLLIFLEKKTKDAPSAVIAYMRRAASSACQTAPNDKNHCIGKTPVKIPNDCKSQVQTLHRMPVFASG